MALVDDDEVEKLRRILLVVRLSRRVVRHDGLENGEIEMARLRHTVMVLAVVKQVGRDALHRILGKLLKIVLGLVGEDVAVANEQDARFLLRASSVPIGLV